MFSSSRSGGVLSARTTGEGQVVDAAMVDGSASLMALSHALMNAGFWHEERVRTCSIPARRL